MIDLATHHSPLLARKHQRNTLESKSSLEKELSMFTMAAIGYRRPSMERL